MVLLFNSPETKHSPEARSSETSSFQASSQKPPSDGISSPRTPFVDSYFSPWLTPLAYPAVCQVILPSYFKHIHVVGQHHLPLDGPAILAPTHRSRWDALVLGAVAGRWITGHDLRFMVSINEVKGLQGWFIRRLGGFAVDPKQPAIASLRHGVEILHKKQMLVIFPEGGIFRDDQVHPFKPGLARLALQAEATQPGLDIKIVPINLRYSTPFSDWRSMISVHIGTPLQVADYQQGTAKQKAQQLTTDLEAAVKYLAVQAADDFSMKS